MGRPLRLDVAGDLTYVIRSPDRGDPSPETSSFHHRAGVSPNVYATFEARPMSSLRLVVTGSAGSNSRVTQPADLSSDIPVDLPQAFAELCAPPVCFILGRDVETMGALSLFPHQRDFTTVDPAFTSFPFTQTAVRGRLTLGDFSATVGISRGPDRVGVGDNNHSPFFLSSLNLQVSEAVALAANYEMGPNQDNDDTHILQNFDAGLTVETGSSRFQLYVVGRHEPQASGALYNWWGLGTYFRVRPRDAPLGVVGRISYTDFNWRNLNLDFGLNIYLFGDRLQIRSQLDFNMAFAGARPFNRRNFGGRTMGEASETTITLQAIVTHSIGEN